MKNLITQSKKNKIDELCLRFGIGDYTINTDGTLDVNGSVVISNTNYTKLPLKFNKVSGDFYCVNNRLETLDGCPTEVGGKFNCHGNKLITLEGCPSKVESSFDCSGNKLTTLRYVPTELIDAFSCSDNRLNTLKFAPSKVGGHFWCYGNQLTDLMYSPSHVSGDYYGYNNQLKSIDGISQYIGGSLNLNNNFSLTNTRCTKYDIVVNGRVDLYNNNLPLLIIPYKSNETIMRLLLKFQRLFEIWNDDLTLNEDNFDELIGEINDGLL